MIRVDSGKSVREFPSISAAARHLGCAPATVASYLNSSKKFAGVKITGKPQRSRTRRKTTKPKIKSEHLFALVFIVFLCGVAVGLSIDWFSSSDKQCSEIVIY